MLHLGSKNELEIVLNENRGSTSHRGCIRQNHKYISCDNLEGHKCLFHKYFAESSIYPSNIFDRILLMGQELVLPIHHEVEANEPYFI